MISSSDLDHRRGKTVLTVIRPDGQPAAEVDVTVQQTRHAFMFGNIGFDFVPLVGGPEPDGAENVEMFGRSVDLELTDIADRWLNLFNTATLPFYWGRYEPRRGRPDFERLHRTAQWFAERGVTVKGHPLVWHTVQPPWLLEPEADEVEALLRQRVRDLTSGFAGLIDVWDAINEPVIMPVFTNGENAITRLAWTRGRLHMIRLAVDEARTGNPKVRLVINDFDLTSAYECLIEAVLEAGIAIDAIGLQTHMHQGYRGEQVIGAALDRFARYGLPLHMTESTIVSGHIMPPEVTDLNDYRIPEWPSTPDGEERQADEITRHYRQLVAHPAVQSINYWGITDNGSWLGAPVGLIRTDGTSKPSYFALENLIKGEWWLGPTPMRTDATGQLTVSGFLGDYEVTTLAETATFTIGDASEQETTLRRR